MKTILLFIAVIICGLIGQAFLGKLGFLMAVIPFFIFSEIGQHNWGSALGLTLLFIIGCIILGLTLLLAMAR